MIFESSAQPPPSLRRRILATAANENYVAGLSIDAYAQMVDTLQTLIAEHSSDKWSTSVTDEYSLRQVIIHLRVVDEIARSSITGTDIKNIDIESETRIAIDASSAQQAEDVVADWQRSVSNLINTARTSTSLNATVCYFGVPMTIEQVIVDRAFETWLHTQDVRRAMGFDVLEPAPPALGLMTDLAAQLLPFVWQPSGVQGTVRLAVDGAAPRSWLVSTSPALAPEEPIVDITVDPLRFCLYIGNRLSLEGLGYEVKGDENLANRLLTYAANLARI